MPGNSKEYMRAYRARKKLQDDQNAMAIKPDSPLVRPRAFTPEEREVLDAIKEITVGRHVQQGVGEPTKEEIAAKFNPEEPIFPRPDNQRGLPRSNYFEGDFAEGIQKMGQKRIDAILDKVNTHKNIRGH